VAHIQIEEYKSRYDGEIHTRARLLWRRDGKLTSKTVWKARKPKSELTEFDKKAIEKAARSCRECEIKLPSRKEIKQVATAVKDQLSRESAIRRYQDKVQRYRRARIRMSENEKQQWADRIGCTIEELELL